MQQEINSRKVVYIMQKINITLTFDDEKLDALEFSLRKEKTSVQARMDKALQELYEQSLPEAVREYLDSKAAAAKPKRSVRTAPKSRTEEKREEKEGEMKHDESRDHIVVG